MGNASTYEALGNIFDSAGKLVAVREHRFEGDARFVVRVDLQFDALHAAVVAEDDFDTIAVVLGLPSTASDTTVQDVGNDPPWSSSISKNLRWGWLMRNHQGYQDGIQFEFAEDPGAKGCTIQLMVEASAIKYLQVVPLHQEEGGNV